MWPVSPRHLTLKLLFWFAYVFITSHQWLPSIPAFDWRYWLLESCLRNKSITESFIEQRSICNLDNWKQALFYTTWMISTQEHFVPTALWEGDNHLNPIWSNARKLNTLLNWITGISGKAWGIHKVSVHFFLCLDFPRFFPPKLLPDRTLLELC